MQKVREGYKKVRINGQQYMQKKKTKKLYTMPRWGLTRKIKRNIAKNELKQAGHQKPNKAMSKMWKDIVIEKLESEGVVCK